ncbi:phosphatidylserine decarboxylase [bacterium]|nr:phosphatidylserine decarboxylase [bacterium]
MDSDGIKFFLFFFLAGIATLAVFRLALNWTHSRGIHLMVLIFALCLFCLSLFMVFFFRDPHRMIPVEPEQIISPADGRIVEIVPVQDDFVGEAIRVAIFMSVFDVHINRAPIAGKVISVTSHNGSFLPAYRKDSSLRNARVISRLMGNRGDPVEIRQIAGILARRIVSRIHPGDRLAAGDRIGLIRFGSRVEILFPAHYRIMVKQGQKVKAGETIVAEVEIE